MSETAEAVADRLQEAFEAGDLALLGPLLSPDVRWGGEGDAPQTCHSRADVLACYGRLHAAGVRPRITETIVREQSVILRFSLTGPGCESVPYRDGRPQQQHGHDQCTRYRGKCAAPLGPFGVATSRALVTRTITPHVSTAARAATAALTRTWARLHPVVFPRQRCTACPRSRR
ncbi:nuclear transport factor 2 family protein [Actinacidiphila paucisporea]|uniref:SnoaL-like domain-containing protein n=1 Tax=Actinacidiphila paucisporea TaxID=310782 RepID=A0A1M7QYF0_9ACTN|nr:nuclear transport factor 2 family protein [Actinacidiphila paucisporea]SHN37011.1 SnoaL-like domain-containing protein [Actinacidiphila paucisporea]